MTSRAVHVVAASGLVLYDADQSWRNLATPRFYDLCFRSVDTRDWNAASLNSSRVFGHLLGFLNWDQFGLFRGESMESYQQAEHDLAAIGTGQQFGAITRHPRLFPLSRTIAARREPIGQSVRLADRGRPGGGDRNIVDRHELSWSGHLRAFSGMGVERARRLCAGDIYSSLPRGKWLDFGGDAHLQHLQVLGCRSTISILRMNSNLPISYPVTSSPSASPTNTDCPRGTGRRPQPHSRRGAISLRGASNRPRRAFGFCLFVAEVCLVPVLAWQQRGDHVGHQCGCSELAVLYEAGLLLRGKSIRPGFAMCCSRRRFSCAGLWIRVAEHNGPFWAAPPTGLAGRATRSARLRLQHQRQPRSDRGGPAAPDHRRQRVLARAAAVP